MTALIAGGELIGVLAAAAVRTRPMDWPVVLVWAAAALVVYAAGTFVSPFLCEGMGRATPGGVVPPTAARCSTPRCRAWR